MEPALRGRVVAAGVALTLVCGYSFSRAATPTIESSPAKLVRAALEAELAGAPATERDRLLNEALAIDPDFAPARWQSGFVKIGKEWIKLDDVPEHALGKRELAEYRKRRDAMIDTADNHRQLARWCRQTRLVDLERVHWAKVLEFEKTDAEAFTALGLQLYEGRLLTKSQIDKERVALRQRARDLRKWQPQIAKWRNAILRGNDRQREAALDELAKLDDPSAIGALETLFSVDGPGENVIAVNRALVETVGRMNVPEATQVLLRRAVLGEPPAVRDLAIDELKKRPLHAYVPQLIAALPGSVKTQFQVFLLPGGMVVHEHKVLFEGREANVSLALESIVNPADPAAAAAVSENAARQQLISAAQIEAQARAAERPLAWLRDRLQHALVRTTGFTGANDPESWEKQYNDYNGWYTPAKEKPTYAYSNSQYQGYATLPVDVTRRFFRAATLQSCFPAGTKIMTQRGWRPIESIKIGDFVLSQDADSGELAYKAVQATTLRPPVDLIKIGLKDESIVATPGHPFWVNGEGWRVAKFLKPGDRLHTMSGPVEIASIEADVPRNVYNLVVSDWHNYFVGQQRLLVHDNSPLEETVTLVPGLASSGP